jgi:hypothetical protein
MREPLWIAIAPPALVKGRPRTINPCQKRSDATACGPVMPPTPRSYLVPQDASLPDKDLMLPMMDCLR